MTIARTIPTRAVEAVWKIACASPDHVEHAGGHGFIGDADFRPARIFMGAFLDDGELPLSPPQLHIYHPIAGRRAIGTSGIDNRDFDVEVEYFFPRNSGGATAPGENHLVDWMEALVNAVIRGATPQRPAGILADPDYPATATLVPPRAGPDVGAMLATVAGALGLNPNTIPPNASVPRRPVP